LDVDGPRVLIPERWRQILREHERFRYLARNSARFQDSANLAAAGQRAFEDALLQAADWLYERTHAEALCFAGGTALNCSANERLLRESKFQRLFIPPAPSDAGTALGCAVYGIQELLHTPCRYRWDHDFMGPSIEREAVDDAVRNADDLLVETSNDIITRMTELLCDAYVVALFQGRSEFGPRALGHRSILADPRRAELRDWINAEVKEREWFRPLAPVVLLEETRQFFDIPRPSPFMQFAARVHQSAASRIPAVTHVDGTARLQTVGPSDDPFLRVLLQAFAARTGVPVLLNTSFNRKEEPIVESPAEAIASFRRTPLHALVMPPYLLFKRSSG
jgi:carbamoyltransferase